MMLSKKGSNQNQSFYMAEPKNDEHILSIVNGVLDRRLNDKSYYDVLPRTDFSDNEELYFGTDKDFSLLFDGTRFVVKKGAVKALQIDYGSNITTIYGGVTLGDDLILRANSNDDYPFIKLFGANEARVQLGGSYSFKIYEGATPFANFNYSGSTFITDSKTGNLMKFSYATGTTTGNIVGHEIDVSTNLTMGANLGATGLKINVKAPNGSGKSQGIDLASLAVDFPVFKVVADAITNPGTLSGQIAIIVGATTYYIPYYTHGS